MTDPQRPGGELPGASNPPTTQDTNPGWTPPPGASLATGGWDPSAAGAEWPAPKRRPLAVIVGSIGLVAAAVAAIAIKVLPFFAAGVIGTALSGAFGGPWERLPSDVRDGYEQRLEAAVGDRMNGLGDAEMSARIQTLLTSGLPRLSDARLVERLLLQTRALQATNESVCAAFGRQSISGQPIADDTGTALISTLAADDLVDWIGINVEAIEAEARGAPGQIYASEAATSALFDTLFATMTPSEIQTIAAVSGGAASSDADFCTAIQSLYRSAPTLDPASQAVMARVDIAP